MTTTTGTVLVYGAAGHTGRFVVDELLRRGLVPILAGRDAGRLAAAARRAESATRSPLEQRVVAVDDPAALAQALSGVGVVINTAGPFLDTALPLARAAIDAGAHYLDVTAEQPSAQGLYRDLDESARAAGVAVIPAMAFYGGLADLLVTHTLAGAGTADEVEIAIGLDHWWPTAGTRVTGARNTATRQVIRGGELVPLAAPTATGTWDFPEPLGDLAVVELPFSEVIVIDRHLEVGNLTSYLNSSSLAEIRDDDTPPPSSSDESGRSEQRYVVDVVVRHGGEERRVRASGRDIYGVSAPIIVEGAARLLDGRFNATGAVAPGQAFDATEVLAELAEHSDGIDLIEADLTVS